MKNEIIWKRKLTKEERRQVSELLKQVENTQSVYHKLDPNFSEEEKSYATHLLYWEGDQLKGYVWCTSFDASSLEATMIVPDSKVVLSVLLKEVKLYSEKNNIKEILFIADSSHLFLTKYLINNQCKLLFSEYYMKFQMDTLVDSLSAAVSLVQPKSVNLPDLELLLEREPLEEDLINTLIYKEEGELLACIRLEEASGLWGIYGFVVNANYRGKGIGRKVLSAVLHSIKEKNPAGIYLEVETKNVPAYQLYLSEGFQVRNQYNYYVLKY
ncbi:GNAT family N-acetyltransferase [Enterococcus sp. CWB-B31]|uniref:GNAT family N-acetyltransferase n=1 Tax=Enterococcus sp. CWB-B31 TaxID=2885159 RepID=UPI001E3CE6DD|nr:GNAT family N-acetyltransferase [Enterococcus sp. CWB-B31]MCB5955914.1 GNAT family N-acetyltransferase [Enterococcus sp. CWB-B31]